MRILMSEENLTRPLGGGELSLWALFDLLRRNNEVIALTKKVKGSSLNPSFAIPASLLDLPRTHMFGKYLMFKQLEAQTGRIIKKTTPDLVITQQDFAAPTIKAADDAGIPSVFFARNYEHLCLCGDPGSRCLRMCAECYGYGPWNAYRYFVNGVLKYERKWLTKATVIFSNSSYMSRILKNWWGIDSPVVYPFIPEVKVRDLRPEFITLINPSRHKGVHTLLEMARRLPDTQFLAVGRNSDRIDFTGYSNITLMPWTGDLQEVYSRTRLLLVPSVWPEPFGRVSIEAGFNGIPSIARDVGGLPEAVGDGGILIGKDEGIEGWLEAVRTLDDPQIYEEYSHRARAHAERFEIHRVFETFRELMERHTGLLI